ncbi:asparagine synthase C-terminal domain-containing protein [Verrucomicrobia bacterium]|nr:asparagine synthase C-terminal domain-containing protein [Verrucomicrobiota bacterium]
MFNEEDKSEYFPEEKRQSSESWIKSISPELKDPVRSMSQADARIIFLSGLLVKIDMATMAYSMEGQSPPLDSELVEFAMTLPSKMLVKGKTGKRVLQDAYRV